jgi:hypothetical protein
MRQLRKPTTVERVTVDLQAQMIVDVDHGAPPGTVRRVRLLCQPGPRVAIAIDEPTPVQAGPGRVYKFVSLPQDIQLPIWLQPQQAIFAVVVPGTGGMSELGYICEFFDEEGPL